MFSAKSAFTTAASVTPGKSKPLVIICVPTRISISPARSSASIRARAPRRLLVSESILSILAAGIISANACVSLSVPKPWPLSP